MDYRIDASTWRKHQSRRWAAMQSTVAAGLSFAQLGGWLEVHRNGVWTIWWEKHAIEWTPSDGGARLDNQLDVIRILEWKDVVRWAEALKLKGD